MVNINKKLTKKQIIGIVYKELSNYPKYNLIPLRNRIMDLIKQKH